MKVRGRHITSRRKAIDGLCLIPTSELVAELDKRIPKGCPDSCTYLGSQLCGSCWWLSLIGEDFTNTKDNFKKR